MVQTAQTQAQSQQQPAEPAPAAPAQTPSPGQPAQPAPDAHGQAPSGAGQNPPPAAGPASAEPDPAGSAGFDWQQVARDLADQALAWAEPLATPWGLIQIVIILAAYALARLASNLLTPPLEDRLRRIEAQPQLLRLLVVPLRRLTWILFALFLWLATLTLQEITWPSRSYYVGLMATLVLAGVIIAIVSRFIRNRSLAPFFAVTAWIIVALEIVGLLDQTLAALDAAAFTIGAFRLSLLVVIKGVLLLTVLLWLATVIGNFLERRIRRNEELAPALQVLFAKFAKFILLVAAILGTLSVVGIDLTALTVFSGALGLGIGFGLQKVASNLLSGVIILSDRSIKPGDVISLGETFGWINALKARYVSVITRDGVEYLIPNEYFVTERVINWSYSNRNVRQEITFGVSYDSDPHAVRRIAGEAVKDLDRVLESPAPVCHVTGFGDSSIDFVLRFWIHDPQNGLANIKGQAFLAIWDAFKEHDIAIPYPHRQLLLPETVTVATDGASPGSRRQSEDAKKRSRSAR